MTGKLRIAMLAHSTNPRGGVVHAMQVAEALGDLGHDVTLFAPDASGKGFFRAPTIKAEAFEVAPAAAGMTAMVEQRIGDYIALLQSRDLRDFDVFHAHDGISGNALATLKQRGRIKRFARTVHHLDSFADPRLMVLQARSIDAADALFTVSDHWSKHFATLGRDAVTVGNGVDRSRFSPMVDASDGLLAARLDRGAGPIFLAVGGVEARKNTLAILEAFSAMAKTEPSAQLVIAGGVSLLDHAAYQARFAETLARLPETEARNVHLIGAVPDRDMPALFRLADALVFASVKEGFGLVVLEAMASGLPVVLSDIPPFTEYVPHDAACWCDPHDPASIADAMRRVLQPGVSSKVVAAGFDVAAAHDWQRVATAHLPTYFAVSASKELLDA